MAYPDASLRTALLSFQRLMELFRTLLLAKLAEPGITKSALASACGADWNAVARLAERSQAVTSERALIGLAAHLAHPAHELARDIISVAARIPQRYHGCALATAPALELACALVERAEHTWPTAHPEAIAAAFVPHADHIEHVLALHPSAVRALEDPHCAAAVRAHLEDPSLDARVHACIEARSTRIATKREQWRERYQLLRTRFGSAEALAKRMGVHSSTLTKGAAANAYEGTLDALLAQTEQYVTKSDDAPAPASSPPAVSEPPMDLAALHELLASYLGPTEHDVEFQLVSDGKLLPTSGTPGPAFIAAFKHAARRMRGLLNLLVRIRDPKLLQQLRSDGNLSREIEELHLSIMASSDAIPSGITELAEAQRAAWSQLGRTLKLRR